MISMEASFLEILRSRVEEQYIDHPTGFRRDSLLGDSLEWIDISLARREMGHPSIGSWRADLRSLQTTGAIANSQSFLPP